MSGGVGHVVILRAVPFLVLCFAGIATARPVDLALVLAVDVSRSVDAQEYLMQKEGYVEAFTSRAVIETVESGAIGAIVVTYVEWSGDGHQRQLVPWTLVRDAETALAFAAAVNATPRAFSDFTAVGGAIGFATQLFQDDSFEPMRRLIDISGDGISNAGPQVDAARERAVAAGITINALTILNEQRRLDAWYAEHVIGGANAFVMPAADFVDFRLALIAKLVREIGLESPAASRFAAGPPP